MCFNMGISRLLGFRKALAAVRAHQWDTAAAEMLDSKWTGQVGARATRLAKMMRTGTSTDPSPKENLLGKRRDP